jgi:hypothetical protein
MPRSDVTIFFTVDDPPVGVNAFITGAHAHAEASAASAFGTANDIEVSIAGASIVGRAAPVFTLETVFDIPNITFFDGAGNQSHDLRQYYSSIIPAGETVDDIRLAAGSAPLPAGVAIDIGNEELDFTDATGEPGLTSDVIIEVDTGIVQSDAEADWQSRISGPDVVWYHDFRSDAEVDQFREDGALFYDPTDDGPGFYGANANSVYRQTLDGITGGGCLEVYRYAGSTDSKNWYRPMSPLSSPGNGRATDDPAASGTIPLDADGAWNPPTFPSKTNQWQAGNYGPASTGSWEGDEFYIQYALKVSSSRLSGPYGGKVQYVTRMDVSLTAQELVTTYGYSISDWQIYRAGSGPFLSTRINDPQHIFDDWATYLVHVVPGDEVDGASGDQGGSNTRVNIYRHRPGESGYTQIFTRNDLATDYSNAYKQAWNAIILSGYFNGFSFPQAFYQRYDQIIFSRSHIPAPAA